MTDTSCVGGTVSSRALQSHGPIVLLVVVLALTSVANNRLSAQTTLPEGIPDFSLDASRSHVQSTLSGRWADPSTWVGGVVPTATQVVRVAQGHTVTIDDTAAVAYTIVVDGKLAFARTTNTRLKVTNLQVMAGSDGMGVPGVLEVGTAASPIASNVTAEIVIANSPLGGSVADPDQFGTGLMAFGTVTMHGSVRTPTFVRVATEPRAGNTTLTLSEAVTGWQVGDRLVLPDTRHIKESETVAGGWVQLVNQWEERTVQAMSADGTVITLNAALQYDHLGARDLNNVLEFLPHVGNITRNVVIRSESAAGTRGHTIYTHMAGIDLRYVLFKDLGRTTYLPLSNATNHIGRYPIHIHHLSGPVPTPATGHQFTLLGNAVDGGSAETRFKWGVTVHGSHYGNIKDNVVYNYNGASVATEDGSESYNVFDHNFAIRGMGEPNDAVSEARMALGTEGVGFWFRGPNNYVTNNVAANFQNPTTEAAYGFVFQFRYLGDIAIPNFPGADTMGMMGPGQSTTVNGNNMPLLQFENNEAYGAMQGGLTYWWVSSLDPQPYADARESVIKNFRTWHVYNKAVYLYPGAKVTFDGLVIRGQHSSASRCCGNGVYFADYSSKGIIIRNSDIQGVLTGITAPEAGFGPEPNLTIENSYLRNWSNLDIPTNGSVNGCWMDNKLVVAINTRFEAAPGQPADHIAMVRDVAYAPECLGKLDELRVYAYNGVATDNFQVYHTNTSVLPRPPAGCTPTTRAGISGLLCPIAALAAVPPTAVLTASPASMTTGQWATLTWTTTNATAVTLDQGLGAQAASGTRVVSPVATTTYALTVSNAVGSVTSRATVTVSPPCTFTLASTTAAATAAAGSGSVGVTASAGTCAWTAASNAAWLTVTGGASVTGNGAVNYSIAANAGTVARTGTITLAGRAFTVTQAGVVCTYTLGATSAATGSAATTGSVGVTASATVCSWTATSNDAWLSVTAGGSGTGSRTVSYSVAANTAASSRTGTLTIAGATYPVVQSGAVVCTYALTPLTQAVGVGGGAATVSVVAPASCSWTAASAVPWLAVTSGTAAVLGNGTVTLAAQPNGTATARSGAVTIAGGGETDADRGSGDATRQHEPRQHDHRLQRRRRGRHAVV